MTKLKISIGKTYNTGNYTSIRLDVGLERDVEEVDGESVSEMKNEIKTILEEMEREYDVS